MAGVRGIRSTRLTNRANCGGPKKAGLYPRHGFMMSDVQKGPRASKVVYGREAVVDNGMMPKTCVASTTKVKVSFPYRAKLKQSYLQHGQNAIQSRIARLLLTEL